MNLSGPKTIAVLLSSKICDAVAYTVFNAMEFEVAIIVFAAGFATGCLYSAIRVWMKR